jgi:excinuclease ABC subunit A
VPASDEITLTGCAQHNLCDLDLAFPADALIFVTGPSGAGKSSLVFGTLHAESRRRYLESLSTAERSRLDQIAPPQLENAENLPLTVAIRSNSLSSGPRNTVGTESGLLAPLQVLFASRSEGFCPDCGQPVKVWQTADVLAELDTFPPDTRLQLGFPFQQEVNSAEAADWLTAAGFRRVVLDDRVLTLEELKQLDRKSTHLTVLVDRVKLGSAETSRLRESLEACYRAGRGTCELFAEGPPANSEWTACELDGRPWSRHQFSRERDCLHCGRSMLDPVPALFRWTSPLGTCPACRGRGVVKLEAGRTSGKQQSVCPACEGARLNPDARGYRLHGSSLPELHALTIREFGIWINRHLEQDLLKGELQRRIEVLNNLGLSDLPLDLATHRLSDAERVSISQANAAAEPFPGALYLIEEPFSGRVVEEWPAVVKVLNRLRDGGAGVCVVQARAGVLQQLDSVSPDRIFRLGPGSGDRGGRLVEEDHEDATAADLPERRSETSPDKIVCVQHLSWPWIEETEIAIAEGGLTVLTGSTPTRAVALLREVLTPALSGEPSPQRESVTFDRSLPFEQVQALTAETRRPHPRQIVAAAVGAFGGIRTVITETDDAKKRNLAKQDLSLFNKQGARCRRCEGTGRIGVDFDFLPEFELNCPECGGSRYEARVSDVRFRGLTLPEMLELTAEEAFRLFKGHHSVQRRLQLLKQVRLGYLRLGQSLTEMSRGERQRLRLAASLAKIRGTRTLLLAEELSWGLANAELPSLLSVLREFTTAGHSVVLVDAHEFWEKNSDIFVRLKPCQNTEN